MGQNYCRALRKNVKLKPNKTFFEQAIVRIFMTSKMYISLMSFFVKAN